MSEVKNNFWVYENTEYPTILVFKNKQPDYMMNGYTEHKVISVDKDLDSYIYFIQHQSDMIKKDYEKLKAQLERAESALNKAISSAEFFSRHADCRKDSWACKCEFCKNTTASKELREAREYFKEKEQK